MEPRVPHNRATDTSAEPARAVEAADVAVDVLDIPGPWSGTDVVEGPDPAVVALVAASPVAALVVERPSARIVCANRHVAACHLLTQSHALGDLRPLLATNGPMPAAMRQQLAAMLRGEGGLRANVPFGQGTMTLVATAVSAAHVLLTATFVPAPPDRCLDALLAAHAPDAQAVFGEDLRIVHANAAMLAGYSQPPALDDVLGRHVRDLGFEDALAFALEQDILAVFATGASRRRDVPTRTGLYDTMFTAATDSEGHTRYVVATARDVSARRRAERHLRQRSSQLERCEVEAGFGTWTWDLDRDVLQLSDEAYRMCGYTPASVDPTLALRGLVADITGLRMRLSDAAEAGEQLVEQFVGWSGGDPAVIQLVSVGPAQRRPGRIWGLLRRAPSTGDALDADALLTALDLAGVAVVVLDDDLRVLAASAEAERVQLELHRCTAPGEGVFGYDSQHRPVPIDAAYVLSSVRDRRPLHGMPIELRRDGEPTRYFSVSSRPIEPVRGAGTLLPHFTTLVVATDEDRLRRAERALAASESRINALVAAIDATAAAHRLYTWSFEPDRPEMTRIDDHAINILGFDPSRLRSDPRLFYEYVHPADMPLVEEAIRDLAGSGGCDVTFRWLRPSDQSTRLHRMLATGELRDDVLVGIAGTVIDISDAPASSSDPEVLSTTVDGLLDQHGSAREPLPVELLPGWKDLSDREQDVVRLTMGGLRSQAIGRRLYVSASTVRNHLSSAYRKLGVHGQVELAGRLARAIAQDAGR